MRKRTIKKYGNTWIIQLSPVDVRDFGFKEGDQIDIENLNSFKKEEDDDTN